MGVAAAAFALWSLGSVQVGIFGIGVPHWAEVGSNPGGASMASVQTEAAAWPLNAAAFLKVSFFLDVDKTCLSSSFCPMFQAFAVLPDLCTVPPFKGLLTRWTVDRVLLSFAVSG